MKFLNKREEYNVIFSKENAIKELCDDPRVESVEKYYNGMVINTIPIIPRYDRNNLNLKYRRTFYLAPTGTYKIFIINGRGKLNIYFVRKEGNIKEFMISYHVHQGNHPTLLQSKAISTTCWGNMSDNVDYICKERDWYWAGKLALDIIYDGNPERSDVEMRFYELQIAFQHNYLIRHNTIGVDNNKLVIDKSQEKHIKELERRYRKMICTPIEEVVIHYRNVIHDNRS